MKNFEHYPKTDQFQIIDTIGVPHPFCITHHHVNFASDHYSGLLGDYAIEQYEKQIGKPSCGVKGCNLYYKEHEQALLVQVSDEKNRELNDIPGLHEYLLKCKPLCEKDGYAGFAFIKK